MDTLGSLIGLLMVFLVMSYGVGYLTGGPREGSAVLKWELQKLKKIGLWLMKHVFQAMAHLFSNLAKACGGGKKKKSP